jgi:hypothetical protein
VPESEPLARARVAVLVELLAELPHAASMKETPSAESARAGRKRRGVGV